MLLFELDALHVSHVLLKAVRSFTQRQMLLLLLQVLQLLLLLLKAKSRWRPGSSWRARWTKSETGRRPHHSLTLHVRGEARSRRDFHAMHLMLLLLLLQPLMHRLNRLRHCWNLPMSVRMLLLTSMLSTTLRSTSVRH